MTSRFVQAGNCLPTCFLISLVVLCGIFCTDTLDKSPYSYQPLERDPTFDGVASASEELKITAREIGSSETSFHIWYTFHNGDTWIRLGEVDTSIDTILNFYVDTLFDSLYDTTYDTTFDMTIDTTYDTVTIDPLHVDTLFDTTIDSSTIVNIDTTAGWIITPSYDTSYVFEVDTTIDITKEYFEESLNKSPNYFLQGLENTYRFTGLVPGRSYFVWIYGERFKNTTDPAAIWEVKSQFTTRIKR